MGDAAKTGPASFANLRAYAAGKSAHYAVEVPFYSDAVFVGKVFEGLGPLVLINTVPLQGGSATPALILRCAVHDDFGREDLLATKDLSHASSTRNQTLPWYFSRASPDLAYPRPC